MPGDPASAFTAHIEKQEAPAGNRAGQVRRTVTSAGADTRGLVVTTSFFTQPALDYIRRVKYRLSGADFEKLRDWLISLRR